MRQFDQHKSLRGFTLAELLIVMAIIGVLVAVSIPIFNTQLERSREATDMANLRAAKAFAYEALMDGSFQTDTKQKEGTYVYKCNTDYWYNPETGKIQEANLSEGYGQGTSATVPGSVFSAKVNGTTLKGNNMYGYNSTTDYTTACIAICYTTTGSGKDPGLHVYFKSYDGKGGVKSPIDDWNNTVGIKAS